MGKNTLTVVPNYKPHAKQMLLHNAPVSYDDIWIILYGGSRGGGKSAGILSDAFLFVAVTVKFVVPIAVGVPLILYVNPSADDVAVTPDGIVLISFAK